MRKKKKKKRNAAEKQKQAETEWTRHSMHTYEGCLCNAVKKKKKMSDLKQDVLWGPLLK